MEIKTTIKLNQPKELPANGLTTVQFKPWKNHITTYLMQDPDNQEFLTGGMYEEWIAASDNPDKTGERISIVQVKTEDMTMHENMLTPFLGDVSLHDVKTKNYHRELLVEAKEKQRKKLKAARNNQLARMIQHIASFVHYTEQDDIVQNSNSVRWIWMYLEDHYNIAPKGANFLRITKHHYKSGVLPATVYKEFRASFLDNLRKKDEPVGTRKPGAKVKEDEVLTPSFEDAIVLWTLEDRPEAAHEGQQGLRAQARPKHLPQQPQLQHLPGHPLHAGGPRPGERAGHQGLQDGAL
jgi:hypothetical protein